MLLSCIAFKVIAQCCLTYFQPIMQFFMCYHIYASLLEKDLIFTLPNRKIVVNLTRCSIGALITD